MSKLLRTVTLYRSSTWLKPSVESLLKSPIVELSFGSELFSISIPQDQGKYLVHQADPLCLGRLNTNGRSSGIPEGTVKDRLTRCHSSLRHGTNTVGLGIVVQGVRCVLRNRVATACGGSGWGKCWETIIWSRYPIWSSPFWHVTESTLVCSYLRMVERGSRRQVVCSAHHGARVRKEK